MFEVATKTSILGASSAPSKIGLVRNVPAPDNKVGIRLSVLELLFCTPLLSKPRGLDWTGQQNTLDCYPKPPVSDTLRTHKACERNPSNLDLISLFHLDNTWTPEHLCHRASCPSPTKSTACCSYHLACIPRPAKHNILPSWRLHSLRFACPSLIPQSVARSSDLWSASLVSCVSRSCWTYPNSHPSSLQHHSPTTFAMSTAVASVAAPLAPPPSEPGSSPQSSFPTLAPSTHTPASAERRSASATSRTTSPNAPVVLSEAAAKQKTTPDGKRSPNS